MSERHPESSNQRNELIRHGLRFSQLRLMLALKETGQISGAAAQLAITQPAASRLLSELERLTGTSLYTRHSRGVTLTAAGERMAQTARDVLHLLDEAGTDVAELTDGTRGEVRIGSVTGPALDLILPVIRDMRVTYPDIAFSVQVDTSDRLAEALTAKAVDFYIGRLQDTLDKTKLSMRVIGREPVTLIVRDGHPLCQRSGLRLSDCLDYDWVMQPPGGLQRQTMETHFLENGHPLPARILGTASLLLTLALVAETDAIAPVSSAVARFHAGGNQSNAAICVLDVGNDIAVTPYSLIRPRDQTLSAAAQRVIDSIEDRIIGAAR